MNEILVYPCGTMIITKLGKFEGMITGIFIRFDKISYEITTVISGEPKTFNYYEQEFETDEQKKPIGYKL